MTDTMLDFPPSIETTFCHDTARVRADDPITSHEAADSNDVEGSVHAVLTALSKCGPVADHELVDYMAGSNWSESRIRTARKTLERQKLVRFTGYYHQTPRGRRTQVWEVVA